MKSVLLTLLLAACAPIAESVRPLEPSEHGDMLLGPLRAADALLDPAGEPAQLARVRGVSGTIVVLTASFCDANTLEPLLSQAAALRKQGLEIVVVSLDHDPRALDGMVRPAEVAVLSAEAGARTALRAQTILPTTLLLDAQGRQLRRYDGEVPLASLTGDLERVPEFVARAANRQVLAKR